ncbi:hypothetical protein B0H14DRAFT_3543983 [Mycena olivaceomarginata]|nr:hypothetical protein B0H14DRAFT_3543983 [Mycena olivaceomarginata]
MTGSLPGDLVFADPYLPPELERQIFEITALSCPKDIPTLMHISRRIKYWVEPLLYRLPPVTTADLLDHITTKSPSFFGSSVTHFYFDGDIPISTLDAILGACLGIDNLVFAPGTYNTQYQQFLSRLRCLRRLATFLRSLFQGPFDFTVPLFCNITHLEIWENYAALQAEICTGLARMPRLTHLALNTVASVVLALHPRLLGHMRLYAIVFFVRHRPNPTPLGVDDARFVCIVRDSCFTDWFHGATSGLDFWALADALITARRAGKVNGQIVPVNPPTAAPSSQSAPKDKRAALFEHTPASSIPIPSRVDKSSVAMKKWSMALGGADTLAAANLVHHRVAKTRVPHLRRTPTLITGWLRAGAGVDRIQVWSKGVHLCME